MVHTVRYVRYTARCALLGDFNSCPLPIDIMQRLVPLMNSHPLFRKPLPLP